jgi:ubiquitin conjugation factor E4 B
MDPNEQPATPDAPDQETMEQIRRRRVAKLGAVAAASSPKPEASESSTAAASSSAAQTVANPTPENATTAVPETATAAKSEEESRASLGAQGPARPSAPSTNNTGSVGDSTRKRRATTEIDTAPGAAPPRKQAGKEESLEDWVNKTLNHLFRVTVDPSQEEDVHGHKLTFLPELSQEILDTDVMPKLSAENLDQAIVEAATVFPRDRPLLEYFLPCWKRVVRQLKLFRGPAPEKEAVLREARRLCFSDAILALTTPELFGREPNPHHDTLVPYLLRALDNEHGVCIDFYNEAVSRFAEDDSIEPLFTKAMVDLSSKLSTLTMNDDYKPYINVSQDHDMIPPSLLTETGSSGILQISGTLECSSKPSLLSNVAIRTRH